MVMVRVRVRVRVRVCPSDNNVQAGGLVVSGESQLRSGWYLRLHV